LGEARASIQYLKRHGSRSTCAARIRARWRNSTERSRPSSLRRSTRKTATAFRERSRSPSTSGGWVTGPRDSRPAHIRWCRRPSPRRARWATITSSPAPRPTRSEEHTSELQSRGHLVCRLLLEKKKSKLCYDIADKLTRRWREFSVYEK